MLIIVNFLFFFFSNIVFGYLYIFILPLNIVVSQVNVQKYILFFFKFMQCLLICLLRVIDTIEMKRKKQRLSSESVLKQFQSDPSE